MSTIAKVEVIPRTTLDGQPDRQILVTRDCGCQYNAGRRLTDDPPRVGERAMNCPEHHDEPT